MNETPPWLAQPERSNRFALGLLVWIARMLGRRAGRAALVPVCAYFLLFSPRARAASRDYLKRVLGRAPRRIEMFRHYYTFATVALDRVFFLSDRWDLFDIAVRGESLLEARLAAGQGCLLLGAHLGSFEVLRGPARSRKLRVSLVMFERNAPATAQVTRAVDPNLAADVISPGQPQAMLRVVERLARGEWVGMLADRALRAQDPVAKVPFLGGEAAFPTAPFRLAAIAGQPIMLMVGLYRGGNRYELCFEELVHAPVLPRAGRDTVLREWVARYAARLEHYCRQAPYNWFNFYEFWIDEAR
ncbi:MAG TPA: acyl-CoA synthetase [Burkholderiales bacterium]|nr:acyl-CoA synthetase [Burkholderiales bacterium]